jgi:excisionase family DNA binding protein
MESTYGNSEQNAAQSSSQIFEPLIEVPEMAKMLNRHPKTVQAMCRRGAIRAMKDGKRWQSRPSEVDAYVRHRISSQHQSRRAEEK